MQICTRAHADFLPLVEVVLSSVALYIYLHENTMQKVFLTYSNPEASLLVDIELIQPTKLATYAIKNKVVSIKYVWRKVKEERCIKTIKN